MKIVSVVAARPNFMKIAPVMAAIGERNRQIARGLDEGGRKTTGEKIEHVLVHTGQHYDELMSDVFFTDLDLPKPDIYLSVGSGSHAVQTAQVMERFEAVLLQERPDVVIVVGDVNSTLACALVAVKISLDCPTVRPLIAHIEAGLRSFDRSMPEEHNRKLTDHLCDLLFVTEMSGLRNLRKEGLSPGKVHFVGNTMIDSLLFFQEKAEASAILEKLGLRSQAGANGTGNPVPPYAVLTLHRPSNVDHRETFLHILEGLDELAARCPIIFPAHPRTQKRIAEYGLEHYFRSNHLSQGSTGESFLGAPLGISLVEPLGYLDFFCLMKHAALVITDSGGIQEETTCLGIPCVTVRENTERPITVTIGTNRIAGMRPARIREVIRRQLTRKRSNGLPKKWDGKSAVRILDVILREFKRKRSWCWQSLDGQLLSASKL